ncbi:NRDE protein-domain-containing protein [Favolaschia claudopus]|uniref:NRDE protein-domain-containing protein n=1 Tax=Favolaschia claudopus TaxID=2862362 RepID=A0AAW0DBJ5_9AGAR
MCVAFWTLDHPDYALILCSNRDEFLARPALPAAFHDHSPEMAEHDATVSDPSSGLPDGNTLLSGRDTQAGGTWLGLAPARGRVALLTNITEAYQNFPSSRGELAYRFLLGRPTTSLEDLFPQAAYSGFNLLTLEARWQLDPQGLGKPSSLQFAFTNASILSNGGAGGQITSRKLRTDEFTCAGLSNGLHVSDTAGEQWPKVSQGRSLFASAIAAHDAELKADRDAKAAEEDPFADEALARRLFAIMRTTAPEPVRAREELRRTICVRPLEMGAKVPDAPPAYYGTRTATVLLVRRSGEALFVERDVWRLAPHAAEGVELYQGGRIGGTEDAGEDAGERVFRVKMNVFM